MSRRGIEDLRSPCSIEAEQACVGLVAAVSESFGSRLLAEDELEKKPARMPALPARKGGAMLSDRF